MRRDAVSALKEPEEAERQPMQPREDDGDTLVPESSEPPSILAPVPPLPPSIFKGPVHPLLEEPLHPLSAMSIMCHVVSKELAAGDNQYWMNIPVDLEHFDDCELVTTVYKELEGCLLKQFGGRGKGLTNLARSAQLYGAELPPCVVESVKYLAAERNKLMHKRRQRRLEDRARVERCAEEVRDFLNKKHFLASMLRIKLLQLTYHCELNDARQLVIGLSGVQKLFDQSHDEDFDMSLLHGVIGCPAWGKPLIEAVVKAIRAHPQCDTAACAILVGLCGAGTAFEARQQYAIDAGAVDAILQTMQRNRHDAAALSCLMFVSDIFGCETQMAGTRQGRSTAAIRVQLRDKRGHVLMWEQIIETSISSADWEENWVEII